MSNPYEHQPFAEPDPSHGQHPLQPQYSPPQLEHLPPQPQWQPSPPTLKQSNGLAITALVVACLALLLVLGQIAYVVLTGLPSVGDLPGTAPQVVAGQPYPGKLLQDEVARVISGDGGEVKSITCPETPAVEADAVAVCHGVVDGFDSEVTVTFEDGLGHFTLVEG